MKTVFSEETNVTPTHELVQEIGVQIQESADSGDKSADKAIFTVFIVWWPWELGQGFQNIINSFNYTNDTIHEVWPESIIWFKRQSTDTFFGQNLTFSAGVTLKI